MTKNDEPHELLEVQPVTPVVLGTSKTFSLQKASPNILQIQPKPCLTGTSGLNISFLTSVADPKDIFRIRILLFGCIWIRIPVKI